VLAAHLSPYHDVVACVRRPFDRYRVISPEIPFEGPAVAVTDPWVLPWDGPVDVVLVTLKTQQTAGAADWFRPLCGPDTIVVTVQNGIEGEARLRPLAPYSTVLPAVVHCGAELVAPGQIRHSSQARFILPDVPASHRLVELAAGTPLRMEPSPRHRQAAWFKLGLNSVANGLTALTGKPMAVVASAGIRRIGRQLLEECWTVARADGVEVDLDRIDEVLDRMADQTASRTSMLHDREAGRPTEHDAIHGSILRRAAARGITTPVTRIVHDLLAAGDPG
jgi:2-dehydropantoate 2-reductase